MNFYPYSSPIILTDDLFVAYGGETGTSTAAQRQAAYLLTEEKATDDLNTFLLPTMVTGTQAYNPIRPYITEYGYVNYVSVVRFLDTEEDIYYTITGTANIHASLRNKERGILDLDYFISNCNCHAHGVYGPYQIQVVYNAGFSSGTSYTPKVLLALSTYSTIILNEITGYGNEAPGDIGIQSFSNQQYAETRRRLYDTTFGSSPKAIFASKLLQSLRKPRYVGL